MRAIFHGALEQEPLLRAAYLAKVCSGDRSMLAEVEALLAEYEKEPEFLNEPAWVSFIQPVSGSTSEAAEVEVAPGLPFDRLGEFRLIRRLGEGGMGVVYLAQQESLGRQVALKVIRPDRMGSFEATKRFWREIEAISKLEHPNIVSVHGSGEEEGIRYFAMQLIPGDGLNEVLSAAVSTSKEKRPSRYSIRSWRMSRYRQGV